MSTSASSIFKFYIVATSLYSMIKICRPIMQAIAMAWKP